MSGTGPFLPAWRRGPAKRGRGHAHPLVGEPVRDVIRRTSPEGPLVSTSRRDLRDPQRCRNGSPTGPFLKSEHKYRFVRRVNPSARARSKSGGP